MEITQIVSGLPPAINGVGDYAFLLAQQLRKEHGINTQFIVCDVNWQNAEILKTETLKSAIGNRQSAMPDTSSGLRPPSPQSGEGLDGFSVFQLKERSAGELLRVLSQPGMPQMVLLQYVGYGYEKRGCPVWLVRALRAWRGQRTEDRGQKSALISDLRSPTSGSSARPRLVTMFHELYAFGPPWRSSFWTSPVQRWIAKSLACSSDHCITNRAASATWLAEASHHRTGAVPILPIFSNLGEPEPVLLLVSRKPQMLVYGGLSRSPNDRDLAVKALRQACNGLGIKRLITFGSRTLDPANMEVPVENLGLLTKKDAGKLLSESRAGYLDYFDGYLAKSGIFAAYSAHGLVPLLLHKNVSDADGLTMGRHYLASSALPEEVGIEAQQRIASQARAWYDGHSVKETSRVFAGKLKLI